MRERTSDQIREHNEDNFLVADLTRKARGLLEANRSLVVGPHGSLFAVCDGMGGAAAGEIASQLAVDILYERMVDGLEGSPAAQSRRARSAARAGHRGRGSADLPGGEGRSHRDAAWARR